MYSRAVRDGLLFLCSGCGGILPFRNAFDADDRHRAAIIRVGMPVFIPSSVCYSSSLMTSLQDTGMHAHGFIGCRGGGLRCQSWEEDVLLWQRLSCSFYVSFSVLPPLALFFPLSCEFLLLFFRHLGYWESHVIISPPKYEPGVPLPASLPRRLVGWAAPPLLLPPILPPRRQPRSTAPSAVGWWMHSNKHR